MKPFSSSSGFGQRCRPITALEAWPSPRGSGSRAITSTPCAASERATARPVIWQLKTSARGVLDAIKRAIDVRDEILAVFDAHRHAQEAVRDPETLLLLRGQTAVRRDRRIEHLGEEIADGRRGCRELERVEEAECRRARVVAELERHDPAIQSVELPHRERVLRMV